MRYLSTNKQSSTVSFREAVLIGQPPDGGLYFPGEIPKLADAFWLGFKGRSPSEIAFEVIKPYVGDDIPLAELRRICAESVAFDFPLIQITPDVYVLELFHGPTLSFKDVGAGFLGRCLEYFSKENDRRSIVLVATSGDTGGAVAAAFAGSDVIDVVILYPRGGVSRFQELQLTAAGDNIHAIEVRGTFDDCQRMVKKAFADESMGGKFRLVSANSINVARWIAQQVYYFFALQQWEESDSPVFAVPSGNFGNLAAGLLAAQAGLPCSGFVAATNANDTVPRYMRTGNYEPRESMSTLSNAMDIGDPSNLTRIKELFCNDLDRMRIHVEAISISDEETRLRMVGVHRSTGYFLDPHGAVGYAALRKHLDKYNGRKGIVLETAHPVKFDCVTQIIGEHITVPNRAISTESMPARKNYIENDYEALHSFLDKFA